MGPKEVESQHDHTRGKRPRVKNSPDYTLKKQRSTGREKEERNRGEYEKRTTRGGGETDEKPIPGGGGNRPSRGLR